MAHTLVLVRGEKKFFENFIKELSSMYLPARVYNRQTKQMEDVREQIRVCPVQLFDISYHKEHRDAIHNHIFSGSEGKAINKYMDKFFGVLRRCLRLQKIDPNYDKTECLNMDFPQHLEIIGIGVKDDEWLEPDGRHVMEKEKSDLASEGI